jgi:ketosteroid isomerase-like protein
MNEVTTFLTRWTEAERDRDTRALDGMLTDDFVGIGPLGFALPKVAWLGRLQTGDLHYDNFDLEEVESRVHGDAALVTARHTAHGNYRGNPIPEAVRASLTLVHDSGAWQLAGIHMSFIAGTPGAPPVPGAATD